MIKRVKTSPLKIGALVLGLFFVVFPGFALSLYVGRPDYVSKYSSGIWICLIFIIIGALLIVYAFKKEKIPRDIYNQLMGAKLFGTFNNTYKGYEKDITDEKDLVMYIEFGKAFTKNFYSMATGVLNAPLQDARPMSSTTAAYIGTQIGGVAVGMVAAAEAERKRREYEENARQVIKSRTEIGSAYDKTRACYNEMTTILRKYPNAWNEWGRKEQELISEVDSVYTY